MIQRCTVLDDAGERSIILTVTDPNAAGRSEECGESARCERIFRRAPGQVGVALRLIYLDR